MVCSRFFKISLLILFLPLSSQAFLWESMTKVEKEFGKVVKVEEGNKIDGVKYSVKKSEFSYKDYRIFAYSNNKGSCVRLSIVGPHFDKKISEVEMKKFLKLVEKGKWSQTETDFLSPSKKWQCVYGFGFMTIVKYYPT